MNYRLTLLKNNKIWLWTVVILFPKNSATIVREFKDDYMKVNYPERIDATARELKIILSQQRTITRSTKNSNTLLVKVGV